jgi:glutaconate CoA-transferase subunit B
MKDKLVPEIDGCSTGEFLAACLARELKDGETAIVGTNSDIQVAACQLARRMHAPGLWWVSGPAGMTNPERPEVLSTADYEYLESAPAWMDLPHMVDFIDWQIHFFDFAILSGLQVDRYGNINAVTIGEHDKPKLRGPGTVGISALTGLAKRFYVVLPRHERSVLVPKVDFVSGPGFLDGGDSREKRGLPPGGPALVVTPLGTFDFEPGTKRMRVRSLSAGVALEKVRDSTGFDLVVTGTPPVTPVATEAELAVLRTQVDHSGVLRKKFP